ncbi:MAG: hypothetical protein OEW19_02330 [Acidobacteriota bacterium]|nr:hypothetical protein [Acidobacteriota bacterium]
MSANNPLHAPVHGAQHHEVAGVRIDIAPAGAGRIKRVIYPAGFRWSRDMRPVSGTDRCMFAHVGFLLQGQVHVEYPDGCTTEFRAPAVVTIEPGHDAWVVGDQAAILVEFDFKGETAMRFGLAGSHVHPQAPAD